MRKANRITVLFLLFGILLFSPWLSAQESAAPVQAEPPPVPEGLKSPRATVGTFLTAMNDIKRGKPERIENAVATLDLSEVSQLVRAERGRDLAWMLLEIMDRTRVVEVGRVPDRTSGNPYLFQEYQNGTVRVSRVADGRWLFDRETVARLPAILDKLADRAKVKGKDTAKDEAYLPLHLRIRAKRPGS